MLRATSDPQADCQSGRRRTRIIQRLLLWAAVVGLCPTGEQVAAAEQVDSTEAEQVEEQFILDLGTFNVKELRPTRNETIKVTFTAHVVLSSGLTEGDFELLQHYQHRLRDQIIVAVRTAQTRDFREPGLDRLRRLIQIRIDQALRVPVTDSFLLSEYQFTLD